MPSDLERAIAEQRRRILAKDRATLVQLMGAYNESMTRLKPMIELAQIAANDAGLTSPAKIFQLERYKILEDQLRAEMQRLAMQTGMAIRGGEAEAIDLGQRAALELVSASARDAATVTASFASVPFEAVREATGVLAPDSPAGKLLDSFGDAAGQRLRQEIINAMALGKNPRSIANAMATAAGISRNRALLIARTETLRAYRTAALQRYAANSDILDGWLWTCAKQTRTCAACLAMDGTLHPLSEQFMKAHPACRCAPRPKLKDEYAMPRDPVESGSEWLARQDADVQDGILGKQGGEAYRAGEVQLSDFVRVRKSDQWGDSTTDGGIAWARQQAAKRERKTAKTSTVPEKTASNDWGVPKFKTHADAESWARSNLKTSDAIDYKTFSKAGIDVVEDTVRAVSEFEQRTGRPAPVNLIAFNGQGMQKTHGRFYGGSKKEIRLRPYKSRAVWDETIKDNQDWLGKHGAPFTIVNNQRDLFFHEVGHAVDSAINYSRGKRIDPSRFKDVSSYAATNESESFAESFAAIATDSPQARSVPDDVAKDIRKILRMDK